MKPLDIIGFIMALLVPLVGFIIGIVIVLKAPPGQSNNGPWVILVSLLGAVFWLLASSA